MNWHVVIMPAVSPAIGQCGLSRAGVVRLLAHLYNDLPARADRLRRRRDATDPNYFVYRVTLLDDGVWRHCEFQVDDVMASGYLFVVRLTHAT